MIELSYDKTVIEFTEAIEIEPLNADAYLGLAEAYVGIGDTEKAVEVLEDGYDKTGDEHLSDLLKAFNMLQLPLHIVKIRMGTSRTRIRNRSNSLRG